MVLDDILKVIGAYLDLFSYKKLISKYPKIFTETEYKTYQMEYELFFSQKIKEQWEIKNNIILEIINSGGNKKEIESLLVENQQRMLNSLTYALEYCNIFGAVTASSNKMNLQELKNENPDEDKFPLCGYLNAFYFPGLSISYPVNIRVTNILGEKDQKMCSYVNLVSLDDNSKFVIYYKISDIMLLFKLYIELTYQYKSTLLSFKGCFMYKMLNAFMPDVAKMVATSNSNIFLRSTEENNTTIENNSEPGNHKEDDLEELKMHRQNKSNKNNNTIEVIEDSKNDDNKEDEDDEDVIALRAYCQNKNNNNTN